MLQGNSGAFMLVGACTLYADRSATPTHLCPAVTAQHASHPHWLLAADLPLPQLSQLCNCSSTEQQGEGVSKVLLTRVMWLRPYKHFAGHPPPVATCPLLLVAGVKATVAELSGWGRGAALAKGSPIISAGVVVLFEVLRVGVLKRLHCKHTQHIVRIACEFTPAASTWTPTRHMLNTSRN
jgi:hypothetical protein